MKTKKYPLLSDLERIYAERRKLQRRVESLLKFIAFIIIFTAIILSVIGIVTPELTSPIAKKELKLAIERGDEIAIEHYNYWYGSRGIDLWQK